MHPELIRLAAHGKYARYRKVDLHVHTPVSAWCWNQHRQADEPAAGSLTPDDVADAILATDVDLIAVTDHDTVDWFDGVRKSLRQKAKKLGRDIELLPGVEVTTYDGVHLLGIFPADKPTGELRNMLIRFGMRADGVKTERATSDWPVDKVADEITRAGGLLVAPHALNPDLGVWGGENSRHKGKRGDWLNGGTIRILACQEAQKDKLVSALKNAGITRRFTIIRHSDAHAFREIGANATYIKLAEPTIEGLRQVIHEPDLRVSFNPPPEIKYPRLLGIELNGGYFHDELLSFSAHLNALVGSNHAGKSAVVDALRFVFGDRCFDDVAEQQRLLGRIDGILGGGRVRVWFVGDDGHAYRAERETAIIKSGRPPKESFRAAAGSVVTRLDDDLEIPVDGEPSEFLSIDFYGQGSVGKIALDHESHRNMIDSMAGTAVAAAALDINGAELSPALTELQQLGERTQNLEAELDALRQELGGLAELQSQRAALQLQAKSDIFTSFEAWQSAARAVERLTTELATLDARASDLLADSEFPKPLPDYGQVPEINALYAPIAAALIELAQVLSDGTARLSADLRASIGKVRSQVDAFDKDYRDKQDKVREQLASLGLTSQTALIKRIGDLAKRIEDLEQRTVPLLHKKEREAAELVAARAQVVASINEEWGKLRGRRQDFVQVLNSSTGDEIRIEFDAARDKTRYWEQLDRIVTSHSTRGSVVQKRERELQLLVDKLDPASLVELLLARQPDSLVTLAGVTANTAEFMCNLPTTDKLALLAVPADDAVVIKYRRSDEPGYTPLAELSPGERAVALLTVAFVNTKGPIVIDQPEDELGQMLVTSELVETIRRRKQDRQFVIVTHNANIPVLGDAEGVFCLRNDYESESDTRKCYVGAAGAIECAPVKGVLLGLEGGKDSFVQRQAKYNIAG